MPSTDQRCGRGDTSCLHAQNRRGKKTTKQNKTKTLQNSKNFCTILPRANTRRKEKTIPIVFIIAISCQKQGLLAGDEQGNEGREGDNEGGGGNSEGGVAVGVAAGADDSGCAVQKTVVTTALGVVAVSLALDAVARVGAGLATGYAGVEGSLVDSDANCQSAGD